jgi:hypothetical protein
MVNYHGNQLYRLLHRCPISHTQNPPHTGLHTLSINQQHAHLSSRPDTTPRLTTQPLSISNKMQTGRPVSSQHYYGHHPRLIGPVRESCSVWCTSDHISQTSRFQIVGLFHEALNAVLDARIAQFLLECSRVGVVQKGLYQVHPVPGTRSGYRRFNFLDDQLFAIQVKSIRLLIIRRTGRIHLSSQLRQQPLISFLPAESHDLA